MREVLALDVFAAGRPEILADDAALQARVRWVHVSDSAGVARLLDGGELLLSTGQGWPADPAELSAFIGRLAAAGLACLVLELGTHYRYVPAVVVEAARAQGLALVALHNEVKFVQLTEAVHRRIIADQSAALQARDEVRSRFTALALRGSPSDFIVHQLAATLGAPVILENLAHEVVVGSVPPARERELLTGWEARSRAAHRAGAAARADADTGADDADGWLIVPVEARGTRWGHLVALPGPPHPAGRVGVLEQGAIALALGRLTDGAGEEWARIGRRALLEDLLSGRFGAFGAATARVEASGVPVDGACLVGLVLAGGGSAIAEAIVGGVDAAAQALGGRALSSGRPAPGAEGRDGIRLLLSLPPRLAVDDALVTRFVRELPLPPGAPARLVVSVGPVANDLEGGLASLGEAIDLSRSPSGRGLRGGLPAGEGGVTGGTLEIRRSDDRPLARLVASLRDDHRALEHGERMLTPLIEYDLHRGGDLLDVLGAMLAHPGNRTAAASASHLSRSVFYQRIALIQDLLGVDLDDGEVLTALHFALLVRRSAVRA
ncbi:MAG: PucR family transcriptional regulator [Microbacterium sp.]|nr:MAG: PucR family transcriptional regulator [Microbacterium sp.]PZU37416.1 MAG: PucR family transcriptional regulator [Microbacterium sp.]